MNHLARSHYTCLRDEHTSHPRSLTISRFDESTKTKRMKIEDREREREKRKGKRYKGHTEREREREAWSFNGQVEAAASCEVTT